MTDDPSTNSGEPICVVDDCTWPARYGDYCNGHKRMTGFTPSPVQDSERPGYQPPEFIRCDWCGRHGHCGNVICEVCAEKAAAPVPSPVPSRPDTAQIRAMADEITTTGSGFPGLDTLDALTLVLAADWIDDHRCPTPEGGENLTSAEFLAAVRNIEQRHKDGTP